MPATRASTLSATTRATRSSVLGKRTHQAETEETVTVNDNDERESAVSSDPTPRAKRFRTDEAVVHDPNGNKENLPPVEDDVASGVSGAPSRTLRRTTSELSATCTRSPTTICRQDSDLNTATTNSISTAAALLTSEAAPTTFKDAQPIHSRARALLRATCNSAGDFAGRVTESNTLRGFITSFFAIEAKTTEDAQPILYISGSPGCGKTALINNILSALEDDMQTNGVSLSFVNCMAMNSIDAIWERLLADFGAVKKRGKQVASSDAVQKLFATRKEKRLLILDEVDHVAASSQALAKLFSLAQNCSNTLRIIGIANTHTLTSSSSLLSLAGVTGVKTLHFAPYEPGQLVEILNARLGPLYEDSHDAERVKKFLPPPTLKLLSMKIASQSGDVRAIFEVLRNAIDIAIGQKDAAKDIVSPVTPTHIQAALKAYLPASRVGPAAVNPSALNKAPCNSEMVAKVRALGLHARLGLLTMLVACKRSEAGLPVTGTAAPRTFKRTASAGAASTPSTATIDAHQLHTLYSTILAGTKGAFTAVSRSEFADIINLLETVGFISRGMPGSVNTPTSRRKFTRTQSFGAQAADQLAFTEGIRAAEVLLGLGIAEEDKASASPADRLEEEAGDIWERELTRIRKEASAKVKKAASATAGLAAFAEAEEDA